MYYFLLFIENGYSWKKSSHVLYTPTLKSRWRGLKCKHVFNIGSQKYCRIVHWLNLKSVDLINFLCIDQKFMYSPNCFFKSFVYYSTFEEIWYCFEIFTLWIRKQLAESKNEISFISNKLSIPVNPQHHVWVQRTCILF